MSWAEYRGDAVRVVDSAVESGRFGVRVARAVLPEDADAATIARALAEVDPDVDVLVVRHLAGHRLAPAVLAASERLVLPAGTLVYWEVPVGSMAGEPDASLSVERAAPDDEATERLVGDVVTDSFAGYGSHYTLDPLLDDDAALLGYVEWARSSLERRPEDVLVLRDSARPVGVATLAWDEDEAELEILLAGLVSDVQGRGWYGTLLRAVEDEARRRAAGRVVISTQSHNVRVQRAWAKAGLRPFAAVETVHLLHPRHRGALPVG